MRYISRVSLTLCLAVVFFSACNKVPEHARYIPKDAVAVAGVNLKGLSKKIAWNMITGSKLFKEMQQRLSQKSAQNAMGDIEKAGIDYLNTIYVYVKTDKRFSGGNRFTGLVPLSDANEWEAYVKQVFPSATISQHGDRKEASLGRDMYVGWNKDLLIVMNTIQPQDGMNGDAQPFPAPEADMSAEMDKAFGVTKENSVIENKHFKALQDESHDVLFWLNYDQMMNQVNGDITDKSGISISNSLWKDAAFTAGFDFKQGKITGDMQYFVPDSLISIGHDFASTNADKDMLSRLPSQNLDMLMAMHISPKSIKDLLTKTQLLGIANLGLSQTGLNMSLDDILDAFTGDMALEMTDFAVKGKMTTDTLMGQAITHAEQEPTLSVAYAIKINKKENFQKMIDFAKQNGLVYTDRGFVIPINDKDSVHVMVNDQYLVAANNFANANGFLQGTFKGQQLPADVSTLAYNNPWSLYFDFNQFSKNIDPSIVSSPRDSAMLAESRKLLKSIALNGGSFTNNAFQYHLDISFNNTEENSIINLMDFGMKMSDASKLAELP